MKIILNKKDLPKFIGKEKSLGFVPTMGALHLGHISLISKSIKQCKRTIVSIYINKHQFNRKEDFIKYPRNIKNDILKIKKLKVDYLYLPNTRDLYPNGPNKNIKISSFSKKLCGKKRPGHFKAVVDVIDRFIKLIKPSRIYLGKKDMQQLKIIEHYIKINNIKTTVVPCNTIREKNGVACSSRNSLLKKSEKDIASKVYKILIYNKTSLLKKRISINTIKKKIDTFNEVKIDYINLIDINKIIKPVKKNKLYKIFIAYYLRSTRLIDNI
tara:strand:+ start:231 stop:1040 length:810 start_codon:yes stop_codon:yes gene_type:complete